MEHEWGRKITTFGVGDSGATMCSDILLTSGARLVFMNVTNGPQCFLWRIPSNTSLPMNLETATILPGHPHFPYGYPVAADVPL